MRILQVVTLVSPDGAYGGPTRVAVNQCAELRRRGHDVVLTAATRGFSTPPTEVGGVPVQLFPARQLVPHTGFAGLAAPGMVRWFRKVASQFDVVHVHFGRDLVGIVIAAMARRYRIPYVLQPHGMVIPSTNPLAAPLDALATRRLLHAAAAVLFLTELEREQLLEVAGHPLRLVPLNNGVPEYPAARESHGSPEVLYVARLQERKRPRLFVKMAQALLAEGIDAKFTLIGADEGEAPAVQVAIGAESRIRWEGALDPSQIPARMAAAAVYVLPSVREPYPMAVLEALSVGLPVVLSQDCGLAPAVDEERCGIVVGDGSASFSDAVKSILADPGLARAMGDRGRMLMRRKFGMSAIGDRLIDVYSQTYGN